MSRETIIVLPMPEGLDQGGILVRLSGNDEFINHVEMLNPEQARLCFEPVINQEVADQRQERSA